MKNLKAERIKKAYQVLKDYKVGINIHEACKKHNIGNFGQAIKELGLKEEFKKRQPKTQDAIDCLIWLSKYNQKIYKKRKETLGIGTKPYVAAKKYKKHNKLSFLWGLVKLEW